MKKKILGDRRDVWEQAIWIWHNFISSSSFSHFEAQPQYNIAAQVRLGKAVIWSTPCASYRILDHLTTCFSMKLTKRIYYSTLQNHSPINMCCYNLLFWVIWYLLDFVIVNNTMDNLAKTWSFASIRDTLKEA